VKAFRQAVSCGDLVGQQHIGEVIIARTHVANAQWVQKTVMAVVVPPGERSAVAADLYADLCEYLLRQWKNADYTFWEEHFLHCLRFARKHVFEHFLRCEGAWRLERPELSRAVPRSLLLSLDRATQEQLSELRMLHDKQAEAALQAVEESQFALYLLRLHPRMRAIVWLKFWENCTDKKIAQVLSISERTVRSGLRTALEELRRMLVNEEGVSDGAGA
jgi:RNA polymerase sigma factor (sigma-70 family)